MKKKRLENLKKLQNVVLAEEFMIRKYSKIPYIIGNKKKKVLKIFLASKTRLQLLKKAKEKQTKRYHRDDVVRMGGENPCERCVYTRQEYLVHNKI